LHVGVVKRSNFGYYTKEQYPIFAIGAIEIGKKFTLSAVSLYRRSHFHYARLREI
jgi:hypothetical protein